MKKNLICLFSSLCLLTFVASCNNDDETSVVDDTAALEEISKEYSAETLSLGTLSTSGSVTVNALSSESATLVLSDIIPGESSVTVDAALKKTDTGYTFEGESEAVTCNVNVTGTIEDGVLSVSYDRTVTSSYVNTYDLNYISSNGSTIAQIYASFDTGDTQMDAVLNGMAAPVLGQLITQQVESVSATFGEDGTFSFSFQKVGSSEATVMPPASLGDMINPYLTWFEKDDVIYLAVHKDALTILSSLNILPEGMNLESIVNILSLEGDFYTVPINTIQEDELVTFFLGKKMITNLWVVVKPLIGNISDDSLQSIIDIVGEVMDTAQDIKVGLVFKK